MNRSGVGKRDELAVNETIRHWFGEDYDGGLSFENRSDLAHFCRLFSLVILKYEHLKD